MLSLNPTVASKILIPNPTQEEGDTEEIKEQESRNQIKKTLAQTRQTDPMPR